MAFLRLGAACAVIDDEGRVLLSRRGDFDVWNLPGGRLDRGERLAHAAAREVYEETGIIAQVDRAVGLYYLAGRERMTVLYAGWPLGGALVGQTGETRANAYFDLRLLPDNLLWGEWMLFDAIAEQRPPPRIVEIPLDEQRRLRWALRRRWIINLLRGQPEARFPRFDVRAVGVIWDEAHRRVLVLPDGRVQTLPRVICDGRRAPWQQLGAFVQMRCGLKPVFHWVGLWQDTQSDALEFVFAATLMETHTEGEWEWVAARGSALVGLDAAYVAQIKPGYDRDPVWFAAADEQSNDPITLR